MIIGDFDQSVWVFLRPLLAYIFVFFIFVIGVILSLIKCFTLDDNKTLMLKFNGNLLALAFFSYLAYGGLPIIKESYETYKRYKIYNEYKPSVDGTMHRKEALKYLSKKGDFNNNHCNDYQWEDLEKTSDEGIPNIVIYVEDNETIICGVSSESLEKRNFHYYFVKNNKIYIEVDFNYSTRYIVVENYNEKKEAINKKVRI